MGFSETRLHPRDIAAKSADWLKGVEKPTISRYQHYDLGGGEKVGLTPAELLPKIDIIRYSTTVALNRLLQRQGPRIGRDR